MGKLIAGGSLIFLGLFMLLGFLASTQEYNFLVDGIMLLLFVFAPILTGSFLVRSYFKAKQRAIEYYKKYTRAAREKEIIRLAQQKGGRVTIPEIVAETSMDAAEAEEIINDLIVKRFADMKMLDSGALVYEFFEMVHTNELEERIHPVEPLKE